VIWEPEAQMRVQVNGMGPGTIRKIVDGGILVHIDKFNLEVKLEIEAMQPFEQSTSRREKPTEASSKDEVISQIEELLGMTEAGLDVGTRDRNDNSNEGIETTHQSSSTMSQSAPVKPTSTLRIPPELLRSRRTLESLRFGLVPHGHIEELTLGFDSLQSWAISCFPDARNGMQSIHKVVGPFGTGKSHTMAVIRYLGAKHGYLTARVEVDGQHISLADPQKLLNAIYASLEGEQFQTETPILSLYEAAISRGFAPSSIEATRLFKLKDNLETISLLKRMGYIDKYDTVLEAVISGSDEYTATSVNSLLAKEPNIFNSQMKLRAPISRAVNERVYDFIEGLVTISHLAWVAGYRGIVLTIDEFEVEVNLDRSRKERVLDLLQVLGNYMQGDQTGMPSAPIAVFFGTVGQDSNPMDASIERTVQATAGSVYTLHTWSRDQRLELAQKIHELYQYSYGLIAPFSPKGASDVETILEKRGYDDSGLIRQFIKWYVALLDMLHGPPGS